MLHGIELYFKISRIDVIFKFNWKSCIFHKCVPRREGALVGKRLWISKKKMRQAVMEGLRCSKITT